MIRSATRRYVRGTAPERGRRPAGTWVLIASLLTTTACSGTPTPSSAPLRSSTTAAALAPTATATSPPTVGPIATTTTRAAPTTEEAATTTTIRRAQTTTAPAVTISAGACTAAPANQMSATGGGSQLVTVVASSTGSTTAVVTLWQRTGSCWTVAGGPWSGWVGHNGLSSDKSEGDGTSPIGLFGISSTTYGIDADPGVHGSYHVLACGDWWDEEPSSPEYNTFQHVDSCSATNPFGGRSEALWTEAPAYDYFAVIDYNTSPVVPGQGSAIFLHVSLGRATNGCVSLPSADVITLLRWLEPGAGPHIAIGTTSDIDAY